MVSIRDQAENDFVYERFRSGNSLGYMGTFWLGGHATCSGCNDWTWSDGSEFSFTYWDQGQPDNGVTFPEDCMEMGYQTSTLDRWNDWTCSLYNGVVCERKKRKV